MPEKSKSSINNLFVVGGIILAVIVGAVYFFNQNQNLPEPKSDTSTGEASIKEETGDCFIPKKGDAECIVDAVDVTVERIPTNGECRGVRATIQTDMDLAALDPKLQGEVVMQIHPKGQTNDGSADTGVGMGRYSGKEWSTFSFGPDGRVIAKETFSAEIGGRNVIFELKSFADGSCIADEDEMRIKLEMAEGSSGDRVYDIVGASGLMDYLPVNQYPGATR